MKPLVRNIKICSHQADLNFHIFPIVRNQGFELKDKRIGKPINNTIAQNVNETLTRMASSVETNKANLTRSNSIVICSWRLFAYAKEEMTLKFTCKVSNYSR